jgi:hypothetical protein
MTITMSWNRILSLVVAAFYVIGGFVKGGGEGGLIVMGFVILPLACIWFGDAMGGYTGQAGSIGITAPSPGIFVCIAGWILLLYPIVVSFL